VIKPSFAKGSETRGDFRQESPKAELAQSFDRNDFPKFSGKCLLSTHRSGILKLMRTIIVLTVFTLFFFATARCVDAGVMLGESPPVITQCSSAMMANLTPLQEEEQQRCGFRQSEPSGLSGSSVNTVQTVGQSATVGEMDFLGPQLVLSWVLDLTNEILPISPVLDGLLKPS